MSLQQQISRVVRTTISIAALAITPVVRAQSGATKLDAAQAKMFLGDWTLTVEAGRGPQDRPLSIKDVNGKVAAELGGGRGGPVTITDITMFCGRPDPQVQTDGAWWRDRDHDGLDAERRQPDRQAEDQWHGHDRYWRQGNRHEPYRR